MPINPNADDRDHRLPLGARIRPGRGPRPARPLGARGSRPRLSRPPARSAAAARISRRSSRSIRCRASATAASRSSRPARSSNISARRARRCCRAIRKASIARSNGPMRRSTASSRRSSTCLLIDVFFAGEEWAKLRRPGAEDFAKLKLKRVSDWLGDKEWLEGDRFTIGDLMMVTDAALPAPHRPGRRIPQSRRLREARRSAAGVPARARRPARGVPRAPTRRSSSMTYFEGFIVPGPGGQQGRLSQACDRVRAAVPGNRRRAAWSKPGTATCPKARSPTSARRSTPSPTRRSSSPGSNIRDRQARDAANEKMMSDPRMKEMGANMPFDGKRMIMGGFDAIVEEGSGRRRLHRRLRRPGARGQARRLSRTGGEDGEGVSPARRDPGRRGVRRRRAARAKSPTSIAP